MTNNLSILILAGGLSMRMGTDKALLPFEGLPLLVHVFQTAQTLNLPIAIITPWPERYAPLDLPGAIFIAETTVAQGPVAGLICGLERASSEWVLLLACDMPRLDHAVLRSWMQSLPDISNDMLALVPRHDDQWEPLCAFYRKSCLDSLKSYLATGRQSFHQWLAENPTQTLNVTDTDMFFNCNRPEDLVSKTHE
jgi:molybdenum cofactor guanylyltransferase